MLEQQSAILWPLQVNPPSFIAHEFFSIHRLRYLGRLCDGKSFTDVAVNAQHRKISANLLLIEVCLAELAFLVHTDLRERAFVFARRGRSRSAFTSSTGCSSITEKKLFCKGPKCCCGYI